jgi:hypothetical protein
MRSLNPSVEKFLNCMKIEMDCLGVQSTHREICIDEATKGFEDLNARRLSSLSAVLEEFGVRRAWNHALDFERPKMLAELIVPHIHGTVADVLCGDGAVANTLRLRNTHNVTMIERSQNRGVVDRPWLDEIVDYDEMGSHPDFRADTVVLCAVLHHETDVNSLIGMARQIARERLIIVENTVTASVDHGAHLVMDQFFNECLNETELGSPGQHRSVEEWVQLFGPLGKVFHVDGVSRVPGVPLPHDVLVVDLNAST